MEDKTFELLTKMYSDFSEFRKDMQEFKDNTTERLTKIEAGIENNVQPDIKAVYQLQTNTLTKLDNHDLRLKNIEENIETLSAKSLRHSYEIGAIKRQRKG